MLEKLEGFLLRAEKEIRGDLIEVFAIMKGLDRENKEEFFQWLIC